MIWNIIDHRERPYRWKRITAIIEPTWQDNSCKDSDPCDQSEETSDEAVSVYEERVGISLADAIAWANSTAYPVTLYLYDEGHGT
jgi:hypothetical protein